MRPRSGLPAFAFVLTMILASSPVSAGIDACAGGVDAGGTFLGAAALSPPVQCIGNLAAPDDQDWYFVDVGPLATSSTVNVQLCAILVGVVNNPDVHVYFQELGALFPTLGPGMLKASSTNPMPSCDFAAASVSVTAGDVVGNGRWYVQVTRTAGFGDYVLTVT